ncbi:hypothetical protein [Dyadobacter sandarakinus]|uniref:DUF4843 domain-containing protein n=1 Tax=Dyadobacter sandarakinus TaxID=2747268 RepID=A0ABX7I201_9BACT|nr:hypothetical protein [Dyadobacter sandarakinus]QRR00069.1 hypothetical protein HWI92_03640 [Dyadobacter sandarakinus]
MKRKHAINKWFAGSWMLFVCGAAASCGGYRPPEPVEVFHLNVPDAARDTIFFIPNARASNSVEVTVEGTISNLAVVKFSQDTSFTSRSGILISEQGYHSPVIISEIKGDTLFVQYLPIRQPVKGSLTISATFRD